MSEGARPACRLGRPGRCWPLSQALRAGEGVDGRAGAWDPCRQQEVTSHKARMDHRAPGRPAGWCMWGWGGEGYWGSALRGPVVSSGALPGDLRWGDHGSRKGVLNEESVPAGSLALSSMQVPGTPRAGGPPRPRDRGLPWPRSLVLRRVQHGPWPGPWFSSAARVCCPPGHSPPSRQSAGWALMGLWGNVC